MGDQAKHYSLKPNEGKALFVLGDVVTRKLSAAETNSAYSLFEIISVPGGGPAFLHTHSPQETFWILEGDYEIYGRDENGKKYAIAAPAGATVHVPGNVPHGFRNVGKTMGRLLAMYQPATDMANFFDEIGVPMSCCTDPMPIDQMPSPERIAAVLKKYKMEVLEAPGTVCEDAIAKDPFYDMDG
jgi:mannose-6-phosphate isomerase-like protein (cupin superfamily)